jgi:hypothetical protein
MLNFLFIKEKVKLFVCLSNYALCHEEVWGSGCIGPCFLDLGTSWRSVISFMSAALPPVTIR